MRGATIFSKIELRSCYYHVHIKDEDISKTTFRNRYGNYEYTIVPFGLTNVLATFMCLMNGVFKEFLDIFIIVFLDDIMIYSKIEEEHEEHLRNMNIRLSVVFMDVHLISSYLSGPHHYLCNKFSLKYGSQFQALQ